MKGTKLSENILKHIENKAFFYYYCCNNNSFLLIYSFTERIFLSTFCYKYLITKKTILKALV